MAVAKAPVLDEVEGASLKDRIARRRVELQEEHHVDIPVPGYEDILLARYVSLDYHVLRRIGKNSEKEPDPVDTELAVAADTLVAACVGIFEVSSTPGEPVETGFRWGTEAARRLFDVSTLDLPDGTTARDSMFAVFPDNVSVVTHFAEYGTQIAENRHLVDEVIQGESEAA